MEGYLCLLAVILLGVQQLMVQHKNAPTARTCKGRDEPFELRSAAQQSETPKTKGRERRGEERRGEGRRERERERESTVTYANDKRTTEF